MKRMEDEHRAYKESILRDPVLSAIESDSASRLKSAISSEGHVNYEDVKERSVLMNSCEKINFEVVEVSISARQGKLCQTRSLMYV
jgi:hypothetical protein